MKRVIRVEELETMTDNLFKGLEIIVIEGELSISYDPIKSCWFITLLDGMGRFQIHVDHIDRLIKGLTLVKKETEDNE